MGVHDSSRTGAAAKLWSHGIHSYNGDIDFDSDDGSLESQDSFADFDFNSDDDDYDNDEVYRESHNQLARQEAELKRNTQLTPTAKQRMLRQPSLGVQGMPLDFIAE